MTNGDVFKKFVTKPEALELIKKGVLFHINNDVKWEGIESLNDSIGIKMNMLYARIMNEIEGEDESDEKTKKQQEDNEIVRRLLAKQAEQMDIIKEQKEQQEHALNQLNYLKAQNEALQEKVDHPDQSLIEEMMKKQNESAEAFKQLMESDETSDIKAKQDEIYNEMMRKQKESEDQIAMLMNKLENEKKSKNSTDKNTTDMISKLQDQLKNAAAANNIIKTGLHNKIKNKTNLKNNITNTLAAKTVAHTSPTKLVSKVSNPVSKEKKKSEVPSESGNAENKKF